VVKILSTASARFLSQMRGKHLLKTAKNALWTKTILWKQISDLSGQFSDHSGQISVFSNDKFVGDMGWWAIVYTIILSFHHGNMVDIFYNNSSVYHHNNCTSWQTLIFLRSWLWLNFPPAPASSRAWPVTRNISLGWTRQNAYRLHSWKIRFHPPEIASSTYEQPIAFCWFNDVTVKLQLKWP
jgi:hypothetical protein